MGDEEDGDHDGAHEEGGGATAEDLNLDADGYPIVVSNRGAFKSGMNPMQALAAEKKARAEARAAEAAKQAKLDAMTKKFGGAGKSPTAAAAAAAAAAAPKAEPKPDPARVKAPISLPAGVMGLNKAAGLKAKASAIKTKIMGKSAAPAAAAAAAAAADAAAAAAASGAGACLWARPRVGREWGWRWGPSLPRR